MSSRCTSSPVGKKIFCFLTTSYFACLPRNSPLKWTKITTNKGKTDFQSQLSKLENYPNLSKRNSLKNIISIAHFLSLPILCSVKNWTSFVHKISVVSLCVFRRSVCQLDREEGYSFSLIVKFDSHPHPQPEQVGWEHQLIVELLKRKYIQSLSQASTWYNSLSFFDVGMNMDEHVRLSYRISHVGLINLSCSRG